MSLKITDITDPKTIIRDATSMDQAVDMLEAAGFDPTVIPVDSDDGRTDEWLYATEAAAEDDPEGYHVIAIAQGGEGLEVTR